jgi:hypothetical protein
MVTASGEMRGTIECHARATSTPAILERLAGLGPPVLACHSEGGLIVVTERCSANWRARSRGGTASLAAQPDAVSAYA